MVNIDAQNIVVVDDDASVADLVRTLLSEAGHALTVMPSYDVAVRDIPDLVPDCVLFDLTMTSVDGHGAMLELIGDRRLARTMFVIMAEETEELDLQQEYRSGVHGVLMKPLNPQTFVDRVERILGDHMNLSFWGVRGTLPMSGENVLRYGGCTSCVTVEFPHGQLFIFDAGSGIKQLSNHLLSQNRARMDGKIFITHPHWDHINFLPFFAPLYMPGNTFEILGARHGDLSIEQIASAQMDGVYFPITLQEFAANVYFRDLGEETVTVDNISVCTMLLSHPGICLGYRVEYGGRSICYITDNEMYLETNEFYNPHYEEKLADFVRGTDVLITDTTYTDEEYLSKVGWGHSCVSKVAKLAHAAEAKNLYLFHHDPDQSDDQIDEKLGTVQGILKDLGSAVNCIAPKEGDLFKI